ncbi:cell wall-binding repeat-containing protein [Euzebya tangerina]|uniref:cell wall-binding repeat-containing protein n=1 Tax=Euzebya tangerina TaxID=591198 RepID=UPI000E320722|nr:cell wall-binding repeat-containing protein [Euzebya tangerina]
MRLIQTLVLTALFAMTLPPPAATTDDGIWFPVATPVTTYSDTWGAPRGESRTHEGTDILAPQMHQIFAAEAGEIIKAKGEDCPADEPCSSYYLAIAGDDGRGYFYVHLNNDTPGRPDGCDGLGGVANAFSPRLVEQLQSSGTLAGVRVAKGEHIGYNGSSGNAACGVDQLHFEIWNDHDWGATGKINPYASLAAAEQAGRSTSQTSTEVPSSTVREAGPDRIGTAVALSRSSHDTAEQVVVAPADQYVAALVAAPLAALQGGPVLLVPPEGSPPVDVVEELWRLEAEHITVVGAVDVATISRLTSSTGTTASTIQGTDPVDLSRQVAAAVRAAGGQQDAAVLAPLSSDPGRGWPDALMGSTLAAYTGAPVLLTAQDQLPQAVIDDLTALENITVIGGTAVISDNVVDQLTSQGIAVRRLAGPERLSTALAVTDAILAGPVDASAAVLHLATADNFPDALAAGPAMSAKGSVLLLMGHPTASTPVLDWVADRAQDINEIHAIGGTAALSEDAIRAIDQQLTP